MPEIMSDADGDPARGLEPLFQLERRQHPPGEHVPDRDGDEQREGGSEGEEVQRRASSSQRLVRGLLDGDAPAEIGE